MIKNTYLDLGNRFFSEEKAASFPAAKLVLWNKELAQDLGLESLDEEKCTAIFTGQELLEKAQPIALAYAGHQFGNFVPRLGDGRALLLGQLTSSSLNQDFDLQLKGSGRTIFSRGGDGRCGLGPALREYILSEAMTALGVPSSRALAMCLTGETIQRETAEQGAVVTRVASSHLRVGTFEYFAAQEDVSSLRKLLEYSIDRHYKHLKEEAEPVFQFFKAVAERHAELTAKFLSVGFIHGVLNTDNFSISGESIDYGPCAFMDEYHPNQVFSSIDRRGRYAYSNQMPIALWNLSRLASCLLLLYPESARTSQSEVFIRELHRLEKLFQQKRDQAFCKKLGFDFVDEDNLELVAKVLHVLEKQKLDFTLSFIRLKAFLLGEEVPLEETMNSKFSCVLGDLRARHDKLGSSYASMKACLEEANPNYIPKNHLVEKAIRLANSGDFSFAKSLLEKVVEPFQSLSKEDLDWIRGVTDEERVTETFCGT